MRNTKKIYILHGWSYTTEKWKPFIDLLKRKNIDVVLLNIPGLTAPLDEVWELDDYVSWLQDALRNEKGPVFLLGHSNGGRIALAYLLLYPEKISKLFLIDSAGIYHNELSIRIKRFVFKTVATLGRKMHKSERLRYWLYRLARETDYQKANPLIRKTMSNLIAIDLSNSLSQISVKTIIIWGEQDKVTPLVDGKLMHEKIKDSTLFLIKNARHSPQFTHVQEVADIVIKQLL